MLNKSAVAEKAAGIFGHKKGAPWIALLCLVIIIFAGSFLAWHVERMKDELMKSQIVERFFTQQEKGKVTQLLTDPQTADLFVKYIDALAGVVSNMEFIPGQSVAQFGSISRCARENDIMIEDFEFEEDGSHFYIKGKADSQQAAQNFRDSMRLEEYFSSVETDGYLNYENEYIFTTTCFVQS